MRKLAVFAIVAALAAGFLGFTSSGHALLSKLGMATACDGGCS